MSRNLLYLSGLILCVMAYFLYRGADFGALPGSEPSYDLDSQDVALNKRPAQLAPPAVMQRDIKMLSSPPAIERGRDKLRLLAIFQSEDQGISSAVILVEGQGAYRYWAGDVLGDDYYLGAILPRSVLLKNGDTLEVLYIDEEYGRNLQSTEIAVTDAEPEPQAEDPPSSDEEIRKRAFLAYVDVRPVTPNAPDGYLVGEGFPKETSEKTGVRPGDIIVSVNGYPLGEDSGDQLAWKSVQATEQATIVVRRDGSEFVVYYP